MVHHHSPALRGLVVDVGSENIGGHGAFFGLNLYLFQNVVHCARQRIDTSDLLSPGLNATAVLEHRFKGSAYSAVSNDAWPTGVNTGDIVFVCPAAHQSVNVAGAQGFIERGFNFIGGSAQCGMEFGFVSGHSGLIFTDAGASVRKSTARL